jgi:hypothetical protein
MEVWQYRPQGNVIESLEWLTDIIRCKQVEYRHSLYSYPRQGFVFGLVLDEATYGLAREKARLVGGDPLYVPDWPRLVEIPAISASTVSLPVDASHISALNVDASVLIWESNTKYEVCTITGIGEGTISISATTQGYDYPTVVPLREGTFAQAFTSTRRAGHDVEAQAVFTITVTEDMTDADAVAYPTYLSASLVLTPRELIHSVEDVTDREVERFDGKITGIVNYPLYSEATTAMSVALTAQTLQEAINLRTFLVAMRGRWKSFWLPSGNPDFTLTKDIEGGDDYIQVADVDFANTYGLGTDVTVLSLAGGAASIRVTSVTTEVEGSERLHFSGAMSGGLPMALVDKVCKLTLSRFDADRIELQYKPGLALTVVVPTQEVPIYP